MRSVDRKGGMPTVKPPTQEEPVVAVPTPKKRNWAEAEKQVNAEVEARAFQFWEQQGRPVGPEGEAASKKNRHIAEIQLLQEEDEFRRVPIH